MHSLFFHEIWIGLRRNLTMTIALVVVVAISLSLLGTGLLFVKQVDNTRTYWQGKVEVSIYLCTKQSVSVQCKQNGASTQAQRQQIQQTLSSMPQVAGVTYESQAQAYSRFKQEFSNSPSFVVHRPAGRHPGLVPGQAEEPAGRLQHRGDGRDGEAGVDQSIDDPRSWTSSTSCWTGPGTPW